MADSRLNDGWSISARLHREGVVLFQLIRNGVPYSFMVEFRDRSSGGFATGLWIDFAEKPSLDPTYIAALRQLTIWLFAKTPILNVLARASRNQGSDTWRGVLQTAGFAWCGEKEGDRLFELVAPQQGALTAVATGSEGAAQLASQILPSWYPMDVHFSTGSAAKLGQYGWLFRSSGINVIATPVAARTPEPQVEGDGTIQERVLVEDPLRRVARFAALQKTYPLILEDTMLFIEHFNQDFKSHPILPGPDTKRWWAALASDGILRIMRGSERRRAKYVCQLGILTRDGEYHVFRAERFGYISDRVRISTDSEDNFPYVNPQAFHSIFVPDGSGETYAEMAPSVFRDFDYRADCADQVSSFLIGWSERTMSSRLF